MASTISGFEYDIFISYRHNDNRSGWVTEFVEALQEELASTINAPVSVYFDTNPHDGLLETHNVGKSLEGKLNCLIFIPVISQTYCDPKSFAWQHEFCTFNKLAKEDQFGRDIKLSNGNVASRILPIKIHDLDAEDKASIENEIGGVLRAIEFIYKEAGVNRPLKTEDKREENLNKTAYRNQINKVANAIKELIISFQQVSPISRHQEIKKSSVPKWSRRKITWLVGVLLGLSLFCFGYYYFGGFGNRIEASLDRSIAVLPFTNMSNDPEQEYVGDGVAEEIINVLAQSSDLKVIARSSSFQYKGKNEDLRKLGEQLGVAHVLEGSVRKSGDSLRITAQLIKTSDGAHLWSRVFKKKTGDIFAIQDEIARAVAEAFTVTMAVNRPTAFGANRNEEAYKLYLQGRFFYERAGNNDFKLAAEYFRRSVSMDSSRAMVWTFLANCEFFLDQIVEGNKDLQKSYQLDSKLPETLMIMAERALADFDVPKSKGLLAQSLQLNPSSPMVLRTISGLYNTFGKYQESFQFAKRAVALDPLQPFSLNYLANALIRQKKYKEAVVVYRKVLEISNDFRFGRLALAIALVKEGSYETAMDEIKKMEDTDERKVILCVVNYKLGKIAESDKLLNEVKNYLRESNLFLTVTAMIYALRDEPEKAMAYLEQAYEARNSTLPWITGETAFVGLQTDPRFVALQKKLKLID